MGMPGSSEYLQELLSRVSGDLITIGCVMVLANDLYISSIEELFINWTVVLKKMQDNNLSLSAKKDFPKKFYSSWVEMDIWSLC